MFIVKSILTCIMIVKCHYLKAIFVLVTSIGNISLKCKYTDVLVNNFFQLQPLLPCCKNDRLETRLEVPVNT